MATNPFIFGLFDNFYTNLVIIVKK